MSLRAFVGMCLTFAGFAVILTGGNEHLNGYTLLGAGIALVGIVTIHRSEG